MDFLVRLLPFRDGGNAWEHATTFSIAANSQSVKPAAGNILDLDHSPRGTIPIIELTATNGTKRRQKVKLAKS